MASSNFYLLFTDGDATHLPSPEEIQRGYKTTDHDGSTEKAHLTFASEMMKQIEKVEKGESEKHSFLLPVPAITENAPITSSRALCPSNVCARTFCCCFW